MFSETSTTPLKRKRGYDVKGSAFGLNINASVTGISRFYSLTQIKFPSNTSEDITWFKLYNCSCCIIFCDDRCWILSLGTEELSSKSISVPIDLSSKNLYDVILEVEDNNAKEIVMCSKSGLVLVITIEEDGRMASYRHKISGINGEVSSLCSNGNNISKFRT